MDLTPYLDNKIHVGKLFSSLLTQLIPMTVLTNLDTDLYCKLFNDTHFITFYKLFWKTDVISEGMLCVNSELMTDSGHEIP